MAKKVPAEARLLSGLLTHSVTQFFPLWPDEYNTWQVSSITNLWIWSSLKGKLKRLVSDWFSGNIGQISNGIQSDGSQARLLLPQECENHQSHVSEVFSSWHLISTWWPLHLVLTCYILSVNIVPFLFHPDQNDWPTAWGNFQFISPSGPRMIYLALVSCTQMSYIL